MSPIPDALSSASLLLAAIALVYSAWSASIDAEVKRTYSDQASIRADQKEETQKILNRRARPIMIACWLVFFAFLPRSFCIFWNTGECFAAAGKGCGYDDVSGIFVLTQIVVAGLALHLGGRVSELREQTKG